MFFRKAAKYRDEHERLVANIDAVLWNEKHGIWMDYDMTNRIHRERFYPSNLFPLLAAVRNK